MKTSIAASIIALTLAGCSSSVVKPQDDPIVTELTGKNINYVQKKLGLPNQRQDTPSGAMVWVYLDKKKGFTANECRVTLSIRNELVENVVIDTDNQSLLSLVSSSCKDIRKQLASNS